jgi:hypothetical protein
MQGDATTAMQFASARSGKASERALVAPTGAKRDFSIAPSTG